MWSYLTTRSLINPLSGYVENKAGVLESRRVMRAIARFLGN
jgi:hypothetical protein